LAWAVKMFMKNDSPPSSDRRRPLRTPPWVEVSTWIVGVIASIAPASARTDSPAPSVTFAAAYAGP
jgi:hypothetical protein